MREQQERVVVDDPRRVKVVRIEVPGIQGARGEPGQDAESNKPIETDKIENLF